MAEQKQNSVQVDILGNIYNNILNGLSKGKDLIMLQGSARCFAPRTKVRMYDGSLKNIEDIELGDRVMNMSGDGYNIVVDLHSGTDMMYKVRQPRGIDYVVNSKHELSLKQTEAFTRKVRTSTIDEPYKFRREPIPYDKNAVIDIPVEEYIAASKNFQRKYAGFKNTMLQLPKQSLKIDPYYLGYWLGNGTSARPHDISTIDCEIIKWFTDFASSLGVSVSQTKCNYRMNICEEGTRNKRKSGAIREFCDAFRYYNLYNNKHIPQEYIYGDYEDRLKLLAGLLDSDGYNSGRNTLSITQKNKQIAESIVELCRISGFYTNGICRKIAKMKRDDGSVYECKVYVIEINHNDFNDLNKYMKVARKRIAKNCERDYFTTKISVEPIGVGEFYGFTLTGDHHFLLEDGTVVKNSGKTFNTLIFIILECLQKPIRERKIQDPVTGKMLTKKEPLRVSIVRNSLPVIKRSVYEDFKTIMINMGQWEDRRMNRTDYIYTFANGATIEFFSAEDEQKLRGPWRHILYINEANEIYYYSFSMLRQRTYEYTIVDYNPSFTEEHWLFPLMKDERSYHFISTYKDNIFLPAPAIREIESYQTTNPALWQIFGKGEFAIVEGLVFPKENWDIIEDDAYPTWLGEEIIGIDWGFTCLVGNTLISTTKGYKRIDQIEVGDMVYNSNGKNKVLKVHKNGTQEVWDFEIRTTCGKIFISATPTHKIKVFPNFPHAPRFYSEDRIISKLKENDRVLLDDGKGFDCHAIVMEVIVHKKHQAEVFDLTIEDCHEYFANGVLVHNCDPTTFVGVIINGEDIYARELHYQMGMKTKDIAEALEPYAGNYKYCDIDNRLVTELEDAGIPLLTMTKKNSESIMSGIRLMNQRRIHVTNSSNDLIKELKNYVYKKDRHDTYQTNLKPIDKFNHCIDALRYVVYAECGGINNAESSERELSKDDLGIFM